MWTIRDLRRVPMWWAMVVGPVVGMLMFYAVGQARAQAGAVDVRWWMVLVGAVLGFLGGLWVWLTHTPREDDESDDASDWLPRHPRQQQQHASQPPQPPQQRSSNWWER